MRLPLFAALVLLASAPAVALTPHLVKDINPLPMASSSSPTSYMTVGSQTFFSAVNFDSGFELWRTDGTVAGTFMVDDLCPGPCSSFASPRVATDRSLFFSVFDGQGSELWVTEGLPVNTFRLTGPLGFDNSSFLWMASRRLLYFTAADSAHGEELWRSDGTAAGTYMVADVNPGLEGSNPRQLTELNGRLFFLAGDGVRGPALWTSDGMAAGTVLVAPVPTSEGRQAFLGVAGHTLYFVAWDPVRRAHQLWKSDGTSHGTARLTSFVPVPFGPTILDLAPLGDRLLFVASDPAKGQELWISDGTTRGTQALTHFARANAFLDGPTNLNPPLLPRSPLGKRLVFSVNDGPHGTEPWITDGTPKGTRLLRDICPGPCSGGPEFVTNRAGGIAIGNLFLFAGLDLTHGIELWATDGTTNGTRMVRDLCPGDCDSFPVAFVPAQGKAFFLGLDRDFGHDQLWRTDGTQQGTVKLTNFQGSFGFIVPFQGVPFGGSFVFTAADFFHGTELWHSDGTPQGTGLLADLNPADVGGSNPTDLKAVGDKVYFIATEGISGPKLWVSDGTDAGTAVVVDKDPAFQDLTDAGGRVFFVSLGETSSFGLWVTDGTPAGTLQLTPDDVNVQGSAGVCAVGSQLFFVAIDPDHGEELWVSDGTPAGTRLVEDLAPGQPGSSPRNLTAFHGNLYFSAVAAQSGPELWRSDGTPGGTVLVKDIDLRPNSGSGPRLFAELAGRLYFFAQDEEHGLELWRTDGTTDGTAMAADLVPGAGGFNATHLISAGSRLFLSGGSNAASSGLWISDGTAAGTSRLSTTAIDAASGLAKNFLFQGVLYFRSAKDQSLWKSDGTAAGTVQLPGADGLPVLMPEAFQSFAGRVFFTSPRGGILFQTDGTPAGTVKVLDLRETGFESFELAATPARLFFCKWDPATGSELWALEAQ